MNERLCSKGRMVWVGRVAIGAQTGAQAARGAHEGPPHTRVTRYACDATTKTLLLGSVSEEGVRYVKAHRIGRLDSTMRSGNLAATPHPAGLYRSTPWPVHTKRWAVAVEMCMAHQAGHGRCSGHAELMWARRGHRGPSGGRGIPVAGRLGAGSTERIRTLSIRFHGHEARPCTAWCLGGLG